MTTMTADRTEDRDAQYTACRISLQRPLDHPNATGRPLYHNIKPLAEQAGWTWTRMELIPDTTPLQAARQDAEEALATLIEITARCTKRDLDLDHRELERALDTLGEITEEIGELASAQAPARPRACRITFQRSLNHPNATGRPLYHDLKPSAEQAGWEPVLMELVPALGPIARDSRDTDTALATLHTITERAPELGVKDVDELTVMRAMETLIGLAETLETAADTEQRPNGRQLTLLG